MKLGIKSISCFLASKVKDFSFYPKGSSINFSNFTEEKPIFINFTQETADFSENWSVDENGTYSSVELNFSVRNEDDKDKITKLNLLGKKYLFLVESISGENYIIGSKAFMPVCSIIDRFSGISSKELNIKIQCNSTHGCFRFYKS